MATRVVSPWPSPPKNLFLLSITFFAVVVAFAATSVSAAKSESLFDAEARKQQSGPEEKSADFLKPAQIEQLGHVQLQKLQQQQERRQEPQPVFDSTSSASSPAASRSAAVFSIHDPTSRKESGSLFDLASSTLVATKTFPFVSDVDKDERVTTLLEQTSSSSSSNRIFNRNRKPFSSKTLFDHSPSGKSSSHFTDDAEDDELPSPRNFDIITFGPQHQQTKQNKQEEEIRKQTVYDAEVGRDDRRNHPPPPPPSSPGVDEFRAFAAARQLHEEEHAARQKKLEKAEATLKELEERIRLEERLAAARRYREEQKKVEAQNRRREQQEAEEENRRRYASEEDKEDGGIVVRLTQRDGELVPAPSSSYNDPPGLNRYYDDLPPAPVGPEARSYNVYQPQQQQSYNLYDQPPPKPAQSYGKPVDNYQPEQGYGQGAELDQAYGRPAVIASNNPQGPVIHITLNQHLPGGEQQGAEQGPAPIGGVAPTQPPVGGGPPGVPAQSDFIPPLASPPGLPQASPTFPPGPPAGPPGIPQATPPNVGPPLQFPSQVPLQSPTFGQFMPNGFQNQFPGGFPQQVPLQSPVFPFQSPPTTIEGPSAVTWVPVRIPLSQQAPQQSPPSPQADFPLAAPTSPPAPAPAPQPAQPVVVVVTPGKKKKGYGDHHDSYDDDHSGYGVKVIKAGNYDNQNAHHQQSDNSQLQGQQPAPTSNSKGRSLSYTIRIPGEQSVSYGKEVRYTPKQQYPPERPTTYISRSNRGSDIFTSGSKPKEIFLDITSDGKVRTSSNRRTKRSIQQATNPKGDDNDVHYFFHIEHDVASDSNFVNRDFVASPNAYGRRDYSVPVTRPLPPPPPPVAPPAPPPPAPPAPPAPASDQPQPLQPTVQFVQAAVPFVQATPTIVQASPAVFQAAPVAPIVLSAPVQQSPAFNIPVRISLAPKPSATVHHYYVPKKKKFKKLKKGWIWF